MLVLSRRKHESIVIGKNRDIIVTITDVTKGGKVKLGIQAPEDQPVHRIELLADWDEADEAE